MELDKKDIIIIIETVIILILAINLAWDLFYDWVNRGKKDKTVKEGN
jgi:hypothetical protein